MIRKLGFYTLIIALLTLLAACGSGSSSPHFIGYIYSKDGDNNYTVIVGVSSKGQRTSDVLIRKGVSKLDIGAKVEVYYTDEGINAIFPANANAKLKEIKADEAEKAMLQSLFVYIYDERGSNVYPSIQEIVEEDDDWIVNVSLISVNIDEDADKVIAYKAAKDGSSFEAVYEE